MSLKTKVRSRVLSALLIASMLLSLIPSNVSTVHAAIPESGIELSDGGILSLMEGETNHTSTPYLSAPKSEKFQINAETQGYMTRTPKAPGYGSFFTYFDKYGQKVNTQSVNYDNGFITPLGNYVEYYVSTPVAQISISDMTAGNIGKINISALAASSVGFAAFTENDIALVFAGDQLASYAKSGTTGTLLNKYAFTGYSYVTAYKHEGNYYFTLRNSTLKNIKIVQMNADGAKLNEYTHSYNYNYKTLLVSNDALYIGAKDAGNNDCILKLSLDGSSITSSVVLPAGYSWACNDSGYIVGRTDTKNGSGNYEYRVFHESDPSNFRTYSFGANAYNIFLLGSVAAFVYPAGNHLVLIDMPTGDELLNITDAKITNITPETMVNRFPQPIEGNKLVFASGLILSVDYNAPIIDGVTVKTLGTFGVETYVRAQDDGVVFNSVDGGTTWKKGLKNRIVENGTHTILVKDAAGNIVESEPIIVTNAVADGYYEENIAATAGQDAWARVHNSGVLEIVGASNQKLYTKLATGTSGATRPQFDEAADFIKTVKFGPTVTKIAPYLLQALNVEYIILPENPIAPDINAFDGMKKLKYIYNYCPTTQIGLYSFLSPSMTPSFVKAYGIASNIGFKTKIEGMMYPWEELTESNGPQKEVTSVSIDASKTFKKVYNIGEALNVTNMFVKVNYNDGTSSSIPVTADMVSGFDPFTLGAQTLTINTGEHTVTTTVTVEDRYVTLSLRDGVYKTEYIKGQALDLTNVSVLATRQSGGMDILPVTADMVTGYNPNTLGQQVVTITKGVGQCQYLVNVTNTLQSIVVSSTAHKTDYALYSELDITDLFITKTFANGETEIVPVTADMVSGFSSSTEGTKTLTINADGKTCTYDIEVVDTVNAIVPVITPESGRTVYVPGEDLDLSGIELTVVSASGSKTIPVTPDMVTGFDPETIGTQTITISYGGQTTTYDVEVKGVGSISGFDSQPKLEYNTGETFDASGAAVTVQTSDGQTITVPVKEEWFSEVDMSTPGTKTVTVTVGGVDYTFDVTVHDGSAIESIELIGVKTVYKQNQTAVAEGQARLTLKNGSTSLIDITADMFTSFNTSTLGTKTATLTINGVTKDFTIEVTALSVKSIALLSPITDYIQNQAFISGGKILITYEDDSTKQINLIEMYAVDFDSSLIGAHTVTVEYGGQSATYEINVSGKTVVNIEITGPRTEYIQNEPFYKAGKVKVEYSNGDIEYVALTSSLLSNFSTSTVGQFAVDVTYKGFTDNYLINVTEFTETTPVTISVVDESTNPVVTSTTLHVTVGGIYREVIAPNGAKIYSNDFRYSVYANGTYTFSVLGRDGKSTDSISIEVSNIDNKAPVIVFSTVGGDITSIQVDATDESGIHKAYAPDGSEITLPYIFDAKTTQGTFRVVDMAGNEASKDYLLTSVLIDGSAASTFVALDGIPDSWTNEAAIVKIGAQNTVDGVTGITTSEDIVSGMRSSIPKFRMMTAGLLDDVMLFGSGTNNTIIKEITVTDNKSIDYTVSTLTGSYNNSVVIDKIDMVDPDVTLTVTENRITVAASDNASGVKSIVLPNGTTLTGVAAGSTASVTDSFTMTGSGTFTVYVMDHAGNVVAKTFTLASENPNGEVTPEPESGGGSGGGGGGSAIPTPVPTEPIKSNVAIKSTIELKSGIKGYVRGYENNVFKPNNYITRAEVAQIIANIVQNEGTIANSSTDTNNAWYTKGVNKTIGLGIMKGYPDKSFKPNASITRQELAITLFNLIDTDKSFGTVQSQLKDISGQYGKSAIEFLAAMDVIHGYEDGTFRPNNKITRAETVTMINNLLAKYLAEETDKSVALTDISKSWAKDQIIKAYIAE